MCSQRIWERCSHLFLSLQVFSIVVFGSIVNEGYLNNPEEEEEFCIYNRNPNACSYGVTVGVLAFLTCLLYLALDVYFPQISSVKDRKKAVLSDIGVSGELALGEPLNSSLLHPPLKCR